MGHAVYYIRLLDLFSASFLPVIQGLILKILQVKLTKILGKVSLMKILRRKKMMYNTLSRKTYE